jgi:hypothetical protein
MRWQSQLCEKLPTYPRGGGSGLGYVGNVRNPSLVPNRHHGRGGGPLRGVAKECESTNQRQALHENWNLKI